MEEFTLHKYKVTLFTKFFEAPVSLSCENIVSYVYINAKNISEVKNRIHKRFNDRKEILKIEKYELVRKEVEKGQSQSG